MASTVRTPPARRQIAAALDSSTYSTVDAMALELGRTKASIAADLIDQGIRALRAEAACGDTLADVLEGGAAPDPVVLTLIDAIEDRLDRLAKTSVTTANRQAVDTGVAFLRWAGERASTSEEMAGVLTAPAGVVLDDLARREGQGAALALAKSFERFLHRSSADRYGAEG